MPYSEIEGVYLIPERQTTIWRYLEPYKFQYLIEQNSIYFTQVEQFSTDFQEGLLSKNDLIGIKRQIFSTNNKNPEAEFQEFYRHYSNIKKSVFISCWMAAEDEHDYMWSNFLSGANGVVIKSTVQSLQNSFNNSPTDFEIFISETHYFNPNELIGPVNLVRQFSRKPDHFENEQEIRAIIIDLPYAVSYTHLTLPTIYSV